jgi:hypothetical protein
VDTGRRPGDARARPPARTVTLLRSAGSWSAAASDAAMKDGGARYPRAAGSGQRIACGGPGEWRHPAVEGVAVRRLHLTPPGRRARARLEVHQPVRRVLPAVERNPRLCAPVRRPPCAARRLAGPACEAAALAWALVRDGAAGTVDSAETQCAAAHGAADEGAVRVRIIGCRRLGGRTENIKRSSLAGGFRAPAPGAVGWLNGTLGRVSALFAVGSLIFS